MNQPADNPSIASPRRFCVLAYEKPPQTAMQPHDPVPIALFLCPENQAPRMLVHPVWRSVVPEPAWGYFEDLLADCRRRLDEDPDGLIEQLCSLSAGPFIAACTPGDRNTDAVLAALATVFRNY